MKVFASLAALVVASIATAAHAGDISGPRAELLVGYDHRSFGFDDGSVNGSGLAYGGAIGYDLPVTSRIALGVDAEIDGATSKVKYDDPVASIRWKFGRDLYAGGRVTVQASKNINFYAKVGYTNTRVTTVIDQGIVSSLSENYGGVRVGAGTQIHVSGPLYGSLEYRYSNYKWNLSRHQVLAGIGYRI